MSEKANPTLIGAFVLGATILSIAGLAVFGGGRFFTEQVTYVAFFDESISGLTTGAAVNFRGVKVGEVGHIEVIVDSNDSVRIPVYLKLQRRRIREADRDAVEGDVIENMIRHGMRAQLELQSIVTGQLQIQLDFHPEETEDYVPVQSEFPEMPTVRSSLAELTDRIESLSLDDLVTNAHELVAGLGKLVNSPDLEASLAGLNEAIQEFRALLAAVNSEVAPLARRLETTLEETDSTLASTRETLASARQALEAARHAMEAATDSLSIAGEDSPLRYEVHEALQELTAAAESVRVLAEYLERNPDALLRGKGGE